QDPDGSAAGADAAKLLAARRRVSFQRPSGARRCRHGSPAPGGVEGSSRGTRGVHCVGERRSKEFAGKKSEGDGAGVEKSAVSIGGHTKRFMRLLRDASAYRVTGTDNRVQQYLAVISTYYLTHISFLNSV